jgi:hypothetical protein
MYTGYTTKDSKKYFQIQLLDPTGTTILAAVPLWGWGDVPVSIYLSKATVTLLGITESTAYIIRMQGLTPLTAVSDTYTLQTTDWHGTDLNELDSWMISTAKNINTYHGWTDTSASYTVTQGTNAGELLTIKGGAFFTSGIPNISNIRPNVFAASSSQPQSPGGVADNVYDKQTWVSGAVYAIGNKVGYNNLVYNCLAVTGAGDTTSPNSDGAHWALVAGEEIWEAQVGTVLASDFTVFGDLFGIGGDELLGFVIWAIILGIAIFGVVSKGVAPLGMILVCFPLILVGNYFRVIGIQVTVVTGALMIFLFVRQFWIKTT